MGNVEQELINPGMQLLSAAWALVFLVIGLVFVALSPHLLIIVFVFPIGAVIAIFFVWEGFYRTPNRIRVTLEGLNLGFKTRKQREIPWVSTTAPLDSSDRRSDVLNYIPSCTIGWSCSHFTFS